MVIYWFSECSYSNKELVGGKNSSLGELYNLSKKLILIFLMVSHDLFLIVLL